jgi:hypothetical protein
MYREKRIRDAVWRQVLEKHENKLGKYRWRVSKTLSMFMVSTLCLCCDLRMYRNAINMCVVWYRVEKKTGKMQDVYASVLM